MSGALREIRCSRCKRLLGKHDATGIIGIKCRCGNIERVEVESSKTIRKRNVLRGQCELQSQIP